MIPIVEDYLSDLIQGKFTSLKNDPSPIDQILGTSQDRKDRLKTFLQTNKPISIIKGYPNTPAIMPCICILLSNEEETQMGLGDFGDDEDGAIQETTEQVDVIDTRGSDYPYPYVKLGNMPLVEIVQITNNTVGTTLEPDEYSITDPDKGIVQIAGGITEDGDSVTVTYTYKQTVVEQMEVLYENNYRLEVWTTNGDLTVEIYHLLKWALLSGRNDLVNSYDIFRQRLSGADFEPVTQMFPDFVYRRALSFWCQSSVSTPDEESTFVTGVVVNQTDTTIDLEANSNG